MNTNFTNIYSRTFTLEKQHQQRNNPGHKFAPKSMHSVMSANTCPKTHFTPFEIK